MRLRDLPGLAAKLEKVYEQAKGYMGIIPSSRKKEDPYGPKKRRRKIKWE